MSNGTGSTASTERMDKMVKQVNANVGDNGSVTNPAKLPVGRMESKPAVTGMIPMSGTEHASKVDASTNPDSFLYNKYSTTQSAIDREGANIVRHQGYGQDRTTGFDDKGFGANIRKVEGVATPEFSKKDQRKSKKILKKQERQDKKRKVVHSKSTDTYHGKYDVSTKRKTITKRSGEVIYKTKNVWRDNEGKRIKTIKSKSKSSATIAEDGRPEEYAEITTSRYNKKKGDSKKRPKQTHGYYVTPEKTGKAYGWGNKNPLGATKATHKKEKTEVKELKKQYRKI